ncbi:hypothetical protein FD754_010206 [Muntiacus muntjak]|uniref:SOCS box domain-containing protein n=1 Tax=Muntiacus muntjak TaxID=9888 RepID=A0A5N3WW52_MUNMU|nr:hypothetical protein FD754_010206 [Muntiacus muntjak]
MDRRSEPVRGRLQIFQKMEKETQARAGSPVLEYHAALVTGDLEHLKPLMDKFFQDANVVFEIKKDEMVWQVKSPATFGLSGTFALLKCAQALLEHGASVQLEGGAGRDTPLHVAAQRCLDEHARLYLHHGARVDARNGRGETALSAACGAARRPDEHARCLRLCALLLRRGAAADARDEDERSPLHKACGHARPSLARLLLRHGADAHALDYGGASPLARVLQTAACAPEAEPQLTVQELLNHGSPTVWPDAFPKMHQAFYRSLFALAHTPRCLQHLCRCAIRKSFGRKCFSLVPLLPLPETLQNYLLLEPEGVLH